MSYESCEAALKSQLIQITGFSSNNVILGNHAILGAGHNRAIVLRYMDFVQEPIGGDGDHNITWGVELAFFTRYIDDNQVHVDARAIRWNIVQRLIAYPQLNHATGVVESVLISGSSGGSPPGGPLANIQFGNVHYYHEVMRVEITENVDTPYAE